MHAALAKLSLLALALLLSFSVSQLQHPRFNSDIDSGLGTALHSALP
jgi:hypothetical protein